MANTSTRQHRSKGIDRTYMHAGQQLAEIATQLTRLIESAVGPARRDAAALASDAPAARQRRTAAKAAAAQAGTLAARAEGIPFLGALRLKGRETARISLDEADAGWTEIVARARQAVDLLKEASRAQAVLRQVSVRARQGGPLPQGLDLRVNDLWLRVRFLAATQGREMARADRLAPNAIILAHEAHALCREWLRDGAARPLASGSIPARHGGQAVAAPVMNVPAKMMGGRRIQMALDFDGTGETIEEPRIWLPVSTTRARELVALGARLDKQGPRRGSKLFVPVSGRAALDQFLPLAFRRQAHPFAFPPIRHNAVGQNLWGVFDAASWNHIRTTAYDRAGHRCQICGKQGGGLWERLATKEERAKGRAVECHEVWHWQVPDPASGTGIQHLGRLLVCCSDCHLIFHDGFALWKAREAGIEQEAADYIKARRMLLNRCDGDALEAQLSADRARWEANLSIRRWVLDLSHLAAQDFMSDHTLVLKAGNKAGMTPSDIGGIAFRTEDGSSYLPTAAAELARGEPARPASVRGR